MKTDKDIDNLWQNRLTCTQKSDRDLTNVTKDCQKLLWIGRCKSNESLHRKNNKSQSRITSYTLKLTSENKLFKAVIKSRIFADAVISKTMKSGKHMAYAKLSKKSITDKYDRAMSSMVQTIPIYLYIWLLKKEQETPTWILHNKKMAQNTVVPDTWQSQYLPWSLLVSQKLSIR